DRRGARRADRRRRRVCDPRALGVPIPAALAYAYLRGIVRGAGAERRQEQAVMTAVQATMSKGVQTVTVSGDENGMRLDRFFEARFPGLSFSHIQRIIRKGEVRVNGKRAQPKDRL